LTKTQSSNSFRLLVKDKRKGDYFATKNVKILALV